MKILYIRVVLLSLVLIFSNAQATQEGDTTIVNVSGTIIENSGSDCTINNGAQQLVYFGDDVYIAKIDGVNYKKTILPVSFKCDEGSNGLVEISFVGAGTGEGCDTVLCTSIPGLGLQIYENESKITLGKKIYAEVKNGSVIIPSSFYAAPVKINSTQLKAGEFTSVMSIIIDVV
ncbi:fimbrial protein [Pantoea allii]|uniref:Fimbrial protein n=1 Tax=Pantoea allii TaxID=574096 RepID=A0ABS6VFK4_9GAMM|nr:fimbrial protein [Pantoea allii]MBW1214088.1 fimbrial protein [Pantoea allii]MBW1253181.1 fimbrial protein [Pantoea allii]MBW1258073.1 fimbrial protein [Pantoea allii]MBW1262723.1 fimbrial protein [Pantoea allii]MBW1267085.1 fimbrial protein [Pantoea allii]